MSKFPRPWTVGTDEGPGIHRTVGLFYDALGRNLNGTVNEELAELIVTCVNERETRAETIERCASVIKVLVHSDSEHRDFAAKCVDGIRALIQEESPDIGEPPVGTGHSPVTEHDVQLDRVRDDTV